MTWVVILTYRRTSKIARIKTTTMESSTKKMSQLLHIEGTENHAGSRSVSKFKNQ